jgi:hypothetical protein
LSSASAFLIALREGVYNRIAQLVGSVALIPGSTGGSPVGFGGPPKQSLT